MPRLTHFWARSLTAALLMACASGVSDAGWVTLRNDSNIVLIVQEAATQKDGTVKRGKPIRLLPGETLRDFQAGPTVKRIEVYDMQAPGKPLYAGPMNWKADAQIFSIASDGKAATVVPVVLKDTIPVRLPVLPKP